MNTVWRAVPLGTARQIKSAAGAPCAAAPNRLIEPAAARPPAFSGGKFAHPTEGFAKCLSCTWALEAPDMLCIRRSCS
ncbi:hypothetical protein X962_3903 [Burkholderia pseudomallei MSHR7343]|nr:hypothetical protein X962_3903 [Burkholderia pseudomallei MSHR7343]KGX68288.1 hypothetical protein Y026_5246 [Burkholderia pseudomallei TSV28]